MYDNVAINIENQKKKNKKLYSCKKTLSLSIVYSMCDHEYGKVFKEKKSIEIKILGLLNNIEKYQKIYNHA